jgi:hypothetical protein
LGNKCHLLRIIDGKQIHYLAAVQEADAVGQGKCLIKIAGNQQNTGRLPRLSSSFQTSSVAAISSPWVGCSATMCPGLR